MVQSADHWSIGCHLFLRAVSTRISALWLVSASVAGYIAGSVRITSGQGSNVAVVTVARHAANEGSAGSVIRRLIFINVVRVGLERKTVRL